MGINLDDKSMVEGPYKDPKKKGKYADKLRGLLRGQGRSKNDPDNKFDPKELALGVKTEMEHTDDSEAAKEIAKDHLVEDKTYYSKVLIPAEKKQEHVRKSHEEGNMNPMDLLTKSSALIAPTATPKPGAAPGAPNKAPRKKRGKQKKVSTGIRSQIHDPGPNGEQVNTTKGGCGYKASMGMKSLMPLTAEILRKAGG